MHAISSLMLSPRSNDFPSYWRKSHLAKILCQIDSLCVWKNQSTNFEWANGKFSNSNYSNIRILNTCRNVSMHKNTCPYHMNEYLIANGNCRNDKMSESTWYFFFFDFNDGDLILTDNFILKNSNLIHFIRYLRNDKNKNRKRRNRIQQQQ